MTIIFEVPQQQKGAEQSFLSSFLGLISSRKLAKLNIEPKAHDHVARSGRRQTTSLKSATITNVRELLSISNSFANADILGITVREHLVKVAKEDKQFNWRNEFTKTDLIR